MVSIIDVLIFINIYWMYLMPAMLIGGYFGIIKLFTFPLLTRNPQELVLVVSPGKVRTYRITNRHLPMFTVRKGAYWFAEGLTLQKIKVVQKTVKKQRGKFGMVKRDVSTEHIEKQITPNIIHPYIDAINQPILLLARNDTKVMDLVIHREVGKQVKAHSVFIPPSLKSFAKNWALILKEDGGEPILEITKQKQPYKIGLFTRIGIYITKTSEKTQTSENASTVLQTISVQTVKQKIGDIEQNANFSAAFAYKIIATIRKLERGWIMSLLGTLDPRIIVVLMAMACIIAAVFLLYKPPELPPPPPGLNL